MSDQKLTRRQQAEMYLKDPNMRRYLDLLSFMEGTQKNGYYTKFGGGRINDLSRHPNQIWDKTGDGATSATGRYQFLTDTWNEQAKILGLKDFGPESQDIAAVSLIMRRGAVDDILKGDIDAANRKLSKEWASLPYNNSPHQSQKTTEEVAQEWERLGGKEYSIPAHQYDYSTTKPQPIAQNTSIPQSLSELYSAFTPTTPNIGQTTGQALQEPKTFTDTFHQLNNTLEPLNTLDQLTEPQTAKPNYREQYQNQLANAFGVEPEMKNAIPDYIGDLVRSIYDQT